MDAQAREHIDQRIGAKEIDPASEQVADARLGYAENFCQLSLRKATRRDHLLKPDHQVRPDNEVLGLRAGKAQIAEDIAGRRSYLNFHRQSTLLYASDIPCQARAINDRRRQNTAGFLS